MSTDLAITAHTLRQRGAKPGTRGPHTNLFSGGLPKTPAVKAAPKTAAQRATDFAGSHKLSSDAGKLLGLVIENFERTSAPLTLDAFELARQTGITFDRAVQARNELATNSVVRVRCDNAWGIDGLVPGDAWNRYRP